ncbi:succinyl-diaminopimelate desuccinylase [Methyloligella sp. 2.7D]|uniref:succinyl-diaminopimelate desuccinylase n=1 Tax=unclassified Methyloligella TaxID=2625955 RepID=UPI00157DD7B1|nr:succinyl-diaminopimelate desuccinylase [Methyloligella sp. GL2]QKP78555.1 succinyl-diaminopimelate desuccinylase [Methyloligella sp. GL2]
MSGHKGGLGEKTIEIAQTLIRCKSITPEDAGALTALEQALGGAGFSFERLMFEDQDTPAIDNLFARAGHQGPHLCFAGHTDVVPPGDEADWSHAPFSADIADGFLYGRGSSDMKGAIAAFAAAALDFIAAKGDALPGSISFLITGDEEGPAVNGTVKVLSWMAEHGHTPSHALVGEPTNSTKLGETIKIGRRGSLNGTLTVKGIQGHVAYPALARNPVKGLIAVLAKFYESPLDQGNDHFTPSNLEVTSIDVGNPATNVIPAKATASFNIRFNDNHTADSLQTLLREQALAVLKDTGLEAAFEFPPAHPAFVTAQGELSTLLSQAVSDITGETPQLSTEGGTSDARFIKDYCPVVEFGLTTETIHKVDERASIADLEQLAVIYRRFLDLYFQVFAKA